MKTKLNKAFNFRAQGLLEYVALISLLMIGSLLVLNLYGVSVSDLYCNAATAIGSQEACLAQETYCEDTFDGDLNGWKPSYGKPATGNGQMCFPSAIFTMNQCSMKTGQSDYVVKLDDVNLYKGDGYGVFFRATDNGKGLNGYAFQYDPGLRSGKYPNGALIIRKWVNGREVYEPIAITPMSPDVYNTPHNFEISANGDILTVNMDGKQVLTAQDDTYTNGGTGIRTWDGTSGCMGNFSILEPLK
jgi:hypothetical protein